jgi:hypothetical protein
MAGDVSARSIKAGEAHRPGAGGSDDGVARPYLRRAVIGYLSTGGTTAARPGMVEVTGGVALSSAAHRRSVWLSFGVCPAGHRGAEWLQRGMPSSK